MEDTLGEVEKNLCLLFSFRLNPCFNGRYSRSYHYLSKGFRVCLNPCFNGRYSRRDEKILQKVADMIVLILVLMEDTLGGKDAEVKTFEKAVLILVLMEDTLGAAIINEYNKVRCVLILVLMEDTLGVILIFVSV